jgi:hypothetical protein
MRLRQVALVARDLEPVRKAFEDVFGLKVAYRDPGVAVYGLVNVVMPVGGEFLEIVQPVKDDASAGRYLARKGGDAGYMLIFQAPDAVRHRARFAEKGIRNIAELNTKGYTFTHFHPADVDGVLTSIDTEGDGTNWKETYGSWTPAGRNWQEARASKEIVGLRGAIVQVPDPAATARRWAELFQGTLSTDGKPKIMLDDGWVTFVPSADPRASGVVGLDVAVTEPHAHLERARKAGLPVKGDAVTIGGIDIHLHAA